MLNKTVSYIYIFIYLYLYLSISHRLASRSPRNAQCARLIHIKPQMRRNSARAHSKWPSGQCIVIWRTYLKGLRWRWRGKKRNLTKTLRQSSRLSLYFFIVRWEKKEEEQQQQHNIYTAIYYFKWKVTKIIMKKEEREICWLIIKNNILVVTIKFACKRMIKQRKKYIFALQ